MKIAAVGFVCMDVYDKLGRMYPTGNGVDFLINLKKLGGVDGSVVSAVGDDEYGKRMKNTLKAKEIDTSHLHVRDGRTAVIKMDLIGNDRVHGEQLRGVMNHFALTDDDMAFIMRQDLIHTDLSGRVADKLPAIRQGGVRVVFDFSVRHDNPGNDRILPYVDYAFFSFGEKSGDISGFLKWAQSFGPRMVVATLGGWGSVAYDGVDFYIGGIVPAARVVNTVGAGDSFAAGFMHGVLGGKSVPDSMSEGAALASRIVQKFEPY